MSGPPSAPAPAPAPFPGYTVLYADENLVAVDKATGLLSVPGIGPEKADCLVARVAVAYPGARIVHRLDQDTSGCIVLAREADTHRELSRQFQDREVEKSYVAIVAGSVAADEGEINLPMRKAMRGSALQMIDPIEGRAAMTRYRVLGRTEGRSRVELHPLTGRSHQLRLHLQAIGHPILGDTLYAPPELQQGRLMLHAWRLHISHPGSGARMIFEAPPPF